MTALVTPEILAHCTTEPIHRPGAIQDHGLLIACDAQGKVIQASANAHDWLGITASSLLGQDLAQVLPVAATALAALPVGPGPAQAQPLDLGALTTPAFGTLRPLAAGVRLARGSLLELERVESPRGVPFDPTALAFRLEEPQESQAIAQAAIAQVADRLGYDRLMAYRFLPGGEGEVIAEVTAPGLEPYLGLRYPASDIPDQVRLLALRCPLRVLGDAEAVPVPLVPDAPLDGAGAWDLGLCAVRSQSPMYREYLRNMGFRASLVASVVVGSRLWGLLIANHRTPRHPDLDSRLAMQATAQALARRLERHEQDQAAALAGRCDAVIRDAGRQISDAGGWMEALAAQAEELVSLLRASGAAIVTPERILGLRAAPAAAAIRAALQAGGPRLIHDGGNRNLAQILGESACGMLAVPVDRHDQVVLCWFRPEHNHEVTWAGDMSTLGKSLVIRPDGVPVFSPRRSFAAWTQQVRGLSRPWTRQDRQTAALLAEGVSTLVPRRIYPL